MKTLSLPFRLSAVALLLAAHPALVPADQTINFQSTLEAVNKQSTGSLLDNSFSFELGAFEPGFEPSPANAGEWLNYWIPIPNSNSSPLSGATTPYSTDPVPFGGPSNAFQGFVTLGSNSGIFTPDTRAFVWGFDARESVLSGEWILLTNDSWKIPTVIPGEIQISSLDWLTSDSATVAVLGSVNPSFDPGFPDPKFPHMATALVNIPEPRGLLLFASALLLAGRRR